MKSIVAYIPVKPGAMDATLAAVQELVAAVGQEPGTLFYSVSIDPSDPNTLVVMERYQDQAAVDAHMAGPGLGGFVAACEQHFAGELRIAVLDEIACI